MAAHKCEKEQKLNVKNDIRKHSREHKNYLHLAYCLDALS